MELSELNLTEKQSIQRQAHRDTNIIYYDNEFYYKILTQYNLFNRTPLGYYRIEGLDLIWNGDSELASNSVGLINKDVIPAFHSFIYDNGVCIGYSTHRGNIIGQIKQTNILKLNYIKYVSKLVEHSIKTGWGYVSVHPNNIVERNGELSFIDLDFSPVNLKNYPATEKEKQIWFNEFRSPDGIYLNMLKSKLQF